MADRYQPLEKGVVDWQLVDEELAAVPPDYKEGKFYPLKQVVQIFSADDPQTLTNDLRETEEQLSLLTDEVIDAYHVGFAKSIQNYSQILQLFKETKDQVEYLKKSLGDSARQLGAHSKNLGQQWRRSVSLQSSVKLLHDVQEVAGIPDRVEAALAAKDWPAAVSQLLEGCTRLARDELMQVAALRKLRNDMRSLTKWIQSQMCDELQSRIYSQALASASGRTGSMISEPSTHKYGSVSRSSRSHLGRSQLALLSSSSAALSGPSFISKASAGKVLVPAYRLALDLRDQSQLRLDSSTSTSLVNQYDPSVEGAADPALRAVPTQEVVSCIAQIDGIAHTKLFLNSRSRSEVHKLMLQAIERAAEVSSTSTAPSTYQASPAAVPPAVQQAAHRIMITVCEVCKQALSNFAMVVLEMAAAPATSSSSAALELLKGEGYLANLDRKKVQESQYKGGGLSSKERLAYVKAEHAHIWQQVQEELALLVSELLGSPINAPGYKALPPKPAAVGFDGFMENLADLAEAALGGGKPAQPVPDKHEKKKAPSKLVFSLDVSIPGVEAGWAGAEATRIQESSGFSSAVRRTLGDRPGTPYLTPCVYLPLMEFMDSGPAILKQYDGQGKAKEDSSKERERWLKQAMEDFVTSTFLPQVFLDLRGRVAAALEERDAFKLQPPSAARDSSTRAVLPVARFAEAVLADALAWSKAMPAYEASFYGVAENALGRMLEAFSTRLAILLGDSKSGQLALRRDVAHVMATEPDAALLKDPVAFFSPRPQDHDVLGFVMNVKLQDRPILAYNARTLASKGPRGFAGEGEAAENDVMLLMLRERPASSMELMVGSGSSQRLMHIAALSDSLDYVAEAIIRLASKQAPDKGAKAARRRGGRRQQQATAPSYEDTVPDSLLHLVHRYKALAGLCVRVLRLEMLLVTAYHLHPLALAQHVCNPDDSREVHAAVGTLTRTAARAAEDLLPYLPHHKALYVFGAAATCAAKTLMWLLPEIRAINDLGVERMVRTLSVLQSALSTLVTANSSTRFADVSSGSAVTDISTRSDKAYESARVYYSLLTQPVDDVIATASETCLRYSYAEWVALLHAHVLDRQVTDQQMQQLKAVLGEVYGVSTAEKVAEVVGTVVSTIQAPVEKVADTLKDTLILGKDTLLAGTGVLIKGVKIPVRQIQNVLTLIKKSATTRRASHKDEAE